MELKYHNDSFVPTALKSPEPEETLEQLMAQHEKAKEEYVRFKAALKAAEEPWLRTVVNEKGETETKVDYDAWETGDPSGFLQWGLVEFNGFNYIDMLEDLIDIKICHLNKKSQT